jgi:phage I-like protein
MTPTSRVNLPTWVKLIPAGEFTGRDGRGPYLLDNPRGVIAMTFDPRGPLCLPIDINHSREVDTRAPVAGWIKALRVRDGAIWGRVEWTDVGKAALCDKHYCYISPVFTYAECSGEIQELLRAALTNDPNLNGMAICSRNEVATMSLSESEKKVADMMGVSESGFAAAKMANRNGRFAVSHHDDPFASVTGEVPDPDGDGTDDGDIDEAINHLAACDADDGAITSRLRTRLWAASWRDVPCQLTRF